MINVLTFWVMISALIMSFMTLGILIAFIISVNKRIKDIYELHGILLEREDDLNKRLKKTSEILGNTVKRLNDVDPLLKKLKKLKGL